MKSVYDTHMFGLGTRCVMKISNGLACFNRGFNLSLSYKKLFSILYKKD